MENTQFIFSIKDYFGSYFHTLVLVLGHIFEAPGENLVY